MPGSHENAHRMKRNSAAQVLLLAFIILQGCQSFRPPKHPYEIGAVWTPHGTNAHWMSAASSSDGEKLVAAAYDGQIHTSADGGNTWIPRETNRKWCSVASSSDGRKLIAAVIEGPIFISNDFGATWIPSRSNGIWRAVASSSDGKKLFAVENRGGLCTSRDSGKTWTQHKTPEAFRCIATSADGCKLVARSSIGGIYTSTNSGETWTHRVKVWSGSSTIASSADGKTLIAGAGPGPINISTNSGETWAECKTVRIGHGVASSTAGMHLTSLPTPYGDVFAMSADGSRLVAVYGPQLFTSTDSGNTWTSHGMIPDWTSPETRNPKPTFAACSADGTKLIVVVRYGKIYTSVPTIIPVDQPQDAIWK